MAYVGILGLKLTGWFLNFFSYFSSKETRVSKFVFEIVPFIFHTFKSGLEWFTTFFLLIKSAFKQLHAGTQYTPTMLPNTSL